MPYLDKRGYPIEWEGDKPDYKMLSGGISPVEEKIASVNSIISKDEQGIVNVERTNFLREDFIRRKTREKMIVDGEEFCREIKVVDGFVTLDYFLRN